jgi:choline dehydrogenase-like flavoprotein
MEQFDYVIVGAGGAGAVLANRLSEDRNTSVLLIERGGRGFNPLLYIPKGFFFTLKSDKLTTTYLANPFPSGYREPWQRGRVLGGSTAVNGMMYVRGQRADFEALEQSCGDRWGWQQFLSAYKAIEDHSLGSSQMRGTGGPVGVTVERGTSDETVRMMLDAAQRAGWPFVEDVNAEDAQHIGFTPQTIKNGVRQSTGNRFLWPIRQRKNLTIATGTTVDRLRFDGRRVVGVVAVRDGSTTEYAARRDVILAAGAIETPLILERSGVGRPDVLSRAGIDVRVESPNVGERVIEQHGAAIQVRFKREIGYTLQLSSKMKQLAQGARYVLTRKGPVATGGYDLMAHIKSRTEVDRPDVQVVGIPFALDFSDGLAVADYPGMYLLGYQIRPTTRSSIHVTSSRLDAPPEIQANYLQTDEDRRVTGAIVDRLREMAAQEPLAAEIQAEEFPGPEIQTPEQVVKFASSPGVSVYHAVGSAAMGREDDDVVAPDLRVRGVDGLRVADISVLPVQVSGNTAAPAMAIGWLAADVVRSTADAGKTGSGRFLRQAKVDHPAA